MTQNSGIDGLILDGGGYTGAHSVRSIIDILSSGVKPKYIQGVSVGAINATTLISGGMKPQLLVRGWQAIEREGPSCIFPFYKSRTIYNLKKRIAGRRYLLDNSGIRRLIDKINLKRVVESEVELHVLVFNETENRQEFFSNHDPEIIANPEMLGLAILASASVPFFFPPVVFRRSINEDVPESVYSDGQLFRVQLAFDYGCDRVFVVLNDSGNDHLDFFDRFIANKSFATKIDLDKECERYGDRIHVVSPHVNVPTLTQRSFKKRDILAAMGLDSDQE